MVAFSQLDLRAARDLEKELLCNNYSSFQTEKLQLIGMIFSG